MYNIKIGLDTYFDPSRSAFYLILYDKSKQTYANLSIGIANILSLDIRQYMNRCKKFMSRIDGIDVQDFPEEVICDGDLLFITDNLSKEKIQLIIESFKEEFYEELILANMED